MSDEEPANIERFSTDAAIDEYRNRASEGLFPQEQTIVRKYFNASTDRILDVGCGTGRTIRVLADRGYDVTGIDVSEPMVHAASELYPDLDVKVGDATDLTFEDEAFEAVLFSYSGLDAIRPETQRMVALEEIRRVLKPRGIFAFSSNNWLYSLPALVLDQQHLSRFYLQHGNLRRLLTQYKWVPGYSSEEVYFSGPYRQWKQLEAVGFDFLEQVGKRDGLGKYFEREPYYIAQKPAATHGRVSSPP